MKKNLLIFLPPGSNNEQFTQTDETNCDLCKELTEVKNNLESQLSDQVKSNFDVMQSLAEKTDENDKLKEEIKQAKEQLDEITKSSNANAEDVNITRLRKAYSNLEKEKKKQEDVHKKRVNELEKAKIDAEEELKLATMKQKDAEDEKDTIVKIFGCMKQLIDRNPIDIPKFTPSDKNNQESNDSSTGAVKKFSCSECDYQGENLPRLNQHKKDKHLVDLTVNYPCEVCDYNAENMDELRSHKKSLHQYDCNLCDYSTTS